MGTINKARAAAKANQVFGANDAAASKKLKLSEADEKRRSELQAEIRVIEDRLPAPLPVADGVRAALLGR